MVTIERIMPYESQAGIFCQLDDFLLGCPTGKYGLPVMDEVPEGLIDIVSAAAKYGESVANIRQWVYRGSVPQVGWLSNPKQNIKVVDEAALLYYRDGPRWTNKGGKHQKAVRFGR